MEQYDDLFHLARQVAGYIKGELTSEEMELLEIWLAKDPENKERFSVLTDEAKLKSAFSTFGSKNKAAAWARITAETGYISKGRKTAHWIRYVAAVLLMGIASGGYLVFRHTLVQRVAENQKLDVLPGSNKATLTLSNGKHINLSDAKAGAIASEANTTIKKNKDGILSYHSNSSHADAKIIYNTITTPRGGQWDLILPDGSKVILDAASSITYPVVFSGNERKVSITGQAYFEVVHNDSKPFRVNVGRQTIKDIGTHFNIEAYNDEPQIKTTLIEGSVSVFNINHKVILTKGEQAVIPQDGNDFKLEKDVDLKQIIAWKEGYFRFHQTRLHELMRELSRWYNVDIIYKGEVNDEPYYGKISRKLTLNEALDILQISGIHFKIGPNTKSSAGTLTITP